LQDCSTIRQRGLAPGTEAARPTREDQSLDGGTAGSAELAFAAVDAVQLLEGALTTLRIDIVSERAAVVFQGLAEDSLDAPAET
jgi:hypothetical protein